MKNKNTKDIIEVAGQVYMAPARKIVCEEHCEYKYLINVVLKLHKKYLNKDKNNFELFLNCNKIKHEYTFDIHGNNYIQLIDLDITNSIHQEILGFQVKYYL